MFIGKAVSIKRLRTLEVFVTLVIRSMRLLSALLTFQQITASIGLQTYMIRIEVVKRTLYI